MLLWFVLIVDNTTQPVGDFATAEQFEAAFAETSNLSLEPAADGGISGSVFVTLVYSLLDVCCRICLKPVQCLDSADVW